MVARRLDEARVIAHEGVEVGSDSQSCCQMDRIEGTQSGGIELCRGVEDRVVDLDEANAVEDVGGAPSDLSGRVDPAQRAGELDDGEPARSAVRCESDALTESL